MADRYFLGGRDLEMLEIRRLLERHAPNDFVDKGLAWGARLSAYGDELTAAQASGLTPVLLELIDDLPPSAFDRGQAVIVDHHGPLAGHRRPTSIEQVFVRLGLPRRVWTRRLALVAANDRGHIVAMKEIGASAEEMVAIRAEDRAAQGVSGADEAEAARAIATRVQKGRATWIETASSTSSAIADQMHVDLGGPGYERLVVVMPGKIAAFGDGAMIEHLATIRGSYWGGDLPAAGFWGTDLPEGCERERILTRIEAVVS